MPVKFTVFIVLYRYGFIIICLFYLYYMFYPYVRVMLLMGCQTRYDKRDKCSLVVFQVVGRLCLSDNVSLKYIDGLQVMHRISLVMRGEGMEVNEPIGEVRHGLIMGNAEGSGFFVALQPSPHTGTLDCWKTIEKYPKSKT